MIVANYGVAKRNLKIQACLDSNLWLCDTGVAL